jgi:protein involved in ribonucleotide reduction
LFDWFFHKEDIELILPISIVYFSHKSENTKRFVEKIDVDATRLPIKWDDQNPFLFEEEYVLVVPTYGGGSEGHAIPKSVRQFLNIRSNRQNLRGVIGTGNTNFGEHYCKAARMIADKAGVPLIAKVELLGTQADVEKIIERLRLLYEHEL